jgi:hypothetical protein
VLVVVQLVWWPPQLRLIGNAMQAKNMVSHIMDASLSPRILTKVPW